MQPDFKFSILHALHCLSVHRKQLWCERGKKHFFAEYVSILSFWYDVCMGDKLRFMGYMKFSWLLFFLGNNDPSVHYVNAERASANIVLMWNGDLHALSLCRSMDTESGQKVKSLNEISKIVWHMKLHTLNLTEHWLNKGKLISTFAKLQRKGNFHWFSIWATSFHINSVTGELLSVSTKQPEEFIWIFKT
jgi:hypothetical protein